MKKVFVFLLMITALSTAALAQKDFVGKFNGQMKQQLKDSLQLTDAQADSVTAIEQSFRPQIRDVMKDESLSQDDKKSKLQALRADEKTRLQSILSQDQLAKLEAMQKNMRQKMRNRNNGGSAPETENK